MNPIATSMLAELGRTTLWLALAGVSAALLLKWARIQSPSLHRLAWCAALLIGCSFVRLPLEVPWYAAEPIVARAPEPEPPPAEISTTFSALATMPLPDADMPPLEFDMPIEAAPPAMLPQTRPVAASPVRWLPNLPQLAIGVWLTGIVTLVAVWWAGYFWFVWRMPAGLPAPADWQTQWNALLAGQGIRRPIPLRVTGNLGPLLCRLPRGYELLVPESLWNALGSPEREAILRHELAHYRRGDVWKSLAARALALVHWFNPVSWWAVGRFDEAAEWACDRAATDGEPTAYAKILVHLSEIVGPRGGYGSALRGHPLAARIRRLVISEQKEDSAMKKTLLIAAAACLVSAALVRVQLVAQEPAKPRNEIEQLFDELSQIPPAVERAAAPPPPPQEEPKPDHSVLRARQKMVETAKEAYGTALDAYRAENTTLESVYVWSSRWLAAALSTARNHASQITAARSHLERMQKVQQQIKSLYEPGTRGGEALEMASANFYVAEAERKLAELESRPTVPQAIAPPQSDHLPIDRYSPPTAPVAPSEAVRPRPPQASARPVPIPNSVPTPIRPNPAPRAVAPPASPAQPASPYATPPVAAPPANPRPNAKPTDDTPTRPQPKPSLAPEPTSEPTPAASPIESRPTLTSPPGQANPPTLDPLLLASKTFPRADRKTDLRYDGKTFDEWVAVMAIELSPERRVEALQAIGAFGANGWGPDAARTILKAVPTLRSTDYRAAVDAFTRIPIDKALPAALKAFQTDDVKQRQFVLNVLPTDQARGKIIPLLEAAIEDDDPKTVNIARWRLAAVDHDRPKLIEWLRAALSGNDSGEMERAFSILCASGGVSSWGVTLQVAPYPALVPEVVALLVHDNVAIRRKAVLALRQMGKAAVPALEREASKSTTATTSHRAAQVLNQIVNKFSAQLDWEQE